MSNSSGAGGGYQASKRASSRSRPPTSRQIARRTLWTPRQSRCAAAAPPREGASLRLQYRQWALGAFSIAVGIACGVKAKTLRDSTTHELQMESQNCQWSNRHESGTGSRAADRGDATSVSKCQYPAHVGDHDRCTERQLVMTFDGCDPNTLWPRLLTCTGHALLGHLGKACS